MIFNDSYWTTDGHKGRAVISVKPVGESYTAETLQKLAIGCYDAEEYLNRDFDFPEEVMHEHTDDRAYIRQIMKNLRKLSNQGDLNLGMDYNYICGIRVGQINDAGSIIVKKVKLDQQLNLAYVNKCASEQKVPLFTKSHMKNMHCFGHSIRLFEQGPVTEKCPMINRVTSWLKVLRSETMGQARKSFIFRAIIDLGVAIKPLTAVVEQRMFKWFCGDVKTTLALLEPFCYSFLPNTQPFIFADTEISFVAKFDQVLAKQFWKKIDVITWMFRATKLLDSLSLIDKLAECEADTIWH